VDQNIEGPAGFRYELNIRLVFNDVYMIKW